jgi:heme exporter protein A
MGTGQATTPHINLDNVAIVRGGRLVIQHFSLSVQSGDIVWIRGANGCGKSTLLRLVAGLLPNASGIFQSSGSFALADENLGLDQNVTLEAALGFWANLDGNGLDDDNGDSDDKLETAIKAMDLQALADIPVRYLSSGQRRRASIARVIASGAEIWLLDEPYNGLDNANCARLDSELLRHAATGGIALVAAHQPPSINVANSIALDDRSAAAFAA